VQEIWKRLEKFEHFEVSNLGNMRRMERTAFDGSNRILPVAPLVPFVAKNGYLTVKLFTKVYVTIHSQVAAAFLPAKEDPKLVLTHIDGNRLNNTPDNLEYVTRGEALRAHWDRKKSSEVWKAIEGHEHHMISSLGRIKTLAHTVTPKAGGIFTIREGIKKPGLSKEGYQVVKLGAQYRRVHELVAAAFLTKEEPNHVIVHLNGDKEDNKESNLCYMGRKEAHQYNSVPHKRREMLKLVKKQA
jgi:hypothetical protein